MKYNIIHYVIYLYDTYIIAYDNNCVNIKYVIHYIVLRKYYIQKYVILKYYYKIHYVFTNTTAKYFIIQNI